MLIFHSLSTCACRVACNAQYAGLSRLSTAQCAGLSRLEFLILWLLQQTDEYTTLGIIEEIKDLQGIVAVGRNDIVFL